MVKGSDGTKKKNPSGKKQKWLCVARRQMDGYGLTGQTS